jgi:imidazolonepropionase-like amidohydrolase
VAVVAAGVDSVEHGMCLDPDLLALMAEQGTALTPTLSMIEKELPGARRAPDGLRKRWFLPGAEAHGPLVAAAAEAGVRVLAGTDSDQHGRIGDEVRALAAAGMRPHDALGAASWDARSYLGLRSLEPDAPADAVVYAEDPRTDLRQLSHPTAVILRGQRVR